MVNLEVRNDVGTKSNELYYVHGRIYKKVCKNCQISLVKTCKVNLK